MLQEKIKPPFVCDGRFVVGVGVGVGLFVVLVCPVCPGCVRK